MVVKNYWAMSTHNGLPRWYTGKESTCRCRRCKRSGFDPWMGKSPRRRKWQPPPVFLPRKFQTAEPDRATVRGVAESDMTEPANTSTHNIIFILLWYVYYKGFTSRMNWLLQKKKSPPLLTTVYKWDISDRSMVGRKIIFIFKSEIFYLIPEKWAER